MKMITLVSLLAASTMAFAQTDDTTNTATLDTGAAAVSETQITQEKPASKKWKAAVSSDAWLNRQASEDMNTASIDSENYVMGAYQITDSTFVGVRQYFDYTYNPDVNNNTETSYTALSLMPRFGGIFGSKDITPNFMVFLPTQAGAEHFERAYGVTDLTFNGYLRADAEIAFDVSPMITLSYYASARQFLFPTQDFTQADGSITRVENLSRYIHLAFMYVNVSDNITPYINAGFDHRAVTDGLTSVKDEAVVSAGVSFNVGPLNITPEINNRTALKDNRQAISNAQLFEAKDMYYELYTTLSF